MFFIISRLSLPTCYETVNVQTFQLYWAPLGLLGVKDDLGNSFFNVCCMFSVLVCPVVHRNIPFLLQPPPLLSSPSPSTSLSHPLNSVQTPVLNLDSLCLTKHMECYCSGMLQVWEVFCMCVCLCVCMCVCFTMQMFWSRWELLRWWWLW